MKIKVTYLYEGPKRELERFYPSIFKPIGDNLLRRSSGVSKRIIERVIIEEDPVTPQEIIDKAVEVVQMYVNGAMQSSFDMQYSFGARLDELKDMLKRYRASTNEASTT